MVATPAAFSTVRSTAASGSQVYESSRAVSEYLLAHFGSADDIMPYKFGPQDGTRFPERLAALCMKHRDGRSKRRAMDVGCAVGAVSFHLTRGFDDVVGIDFSQHFVDAANEMKAKRTMTYSVLKQGDIFEDRVAHLPSGVHASKATFMQGDACNMDKSIGTSVHRDRFLPPFLTGCPVPRSLSLPTCARVPGTFDLIIAANLMCRLPAPTQFLESVPAFLNPGGTFILVSPYSWLEEYTPKSAWVGARAEGGPSFDCVSAVMARAAPNMKIVHREDIPFVIREHERKFQYGVSDVVVFNKE